MAENTINLVELIAKAGKQDLDQVDDRITALTKEIEDFVSVRKAEILSLRMVQRLLNRKLHPQQKSKRNPKATAPSKGSSKLADAIYDILSKDGSMPVPAIAARLGRTNVAIGVCCGRSPWFTSENGEVKIAMKKIPTP